MQFGHLVEKLVATLVGTVEYNVGIFVSQNKLPLVLREI